MEIKVTQSLMNECRPRYHDRDTIPNWAIHEGDLLYSFACPVATALHYKWPNLIFLVSSSNADIRVFNRDDLGEGYVTDIKLKQLRPVTVTEEDGDDEEVEVAWTWLYDQWADYEVNPPPPSATFTLTDAQVSRLDRANREAGQSRATA